MYYGRHIGLYAPNCTKFRFFVSSKFKNWDIFINFAQNMYVIRKNTIMQKYFFLILNFGHHIELYENIIFELARNKNLNLVQFWACNQRWRPKFISRTISFYIISSVHITYIFCGNFMKILQFLNLIKTKKLNFGLFLVINTIWRPK